MKRQISVSIFLAILVIVLAWLYIKTFNETRVREENFTTENNVSKEESVTISQEYMPYSYYVKDEDGRLSVFEMKTQDLFMETGIETYTLPIEIQEKLLTGIFFQTEADLYDFLESYSS